MEYCEKHDVAKVVMPKMGKKLKFEHFYMLMRVPFIVYADFEAFTKPIDTLIQNTVLPCHIKNIFQARFATI